jgi:CRP-like cAMP-binding protein
MQHALSNGRNRLLTALPPAESALLEPYLKEVPLGQGEILQEQGDNIEEVYFPHRGTISLVAAMNQGSKIIEIATVGCEGVVGATASFGPLHAFRRAIVQIGGAATKIPAAPLRQVANHSQALRDILARYNEVLLAQVQQTAACNAFHETEERLARWLLQTHDRIDSNTIPLTQELLAQLLGVRRTTVTIIASDLQERGLLHHRRGRIEIADRQGLEAIACECYGTIRRHIDKYLPFANPSAEIH